MTVLYNEIYSRFFAKADTAMTIMSVSRDDLREFLLEWLHAAAAKPYVRRVFRSFSLDDKVMEADADINNPVDEDADKEYVIDVLACGMVAEWLSPRVYAEENIKQFFAGKEQKFYSQSSHIAELRGLLEDIRREQRGLIRDHGYIWNSYLSG